MEGSGLTKVTALVHEEILVLTLTKDDAVVIWSGSNYVNKNETSNGLKHLKDCINHGSDTNIVAPQRHDLLETSCIDNEIQVFSRSAHEMKLHEIFKAIDNAKI
jgi:hypothetical protein